MASAADTALEKLSMIERPARLVIELGLVIFLALLAARLAWTVVAPVESVADYANRPLPSPMRGTSSSLTIATDRSVLVRDNPFSQGDSEPVIEDAPETSLNLKLIGLRMSTDGTDAGNAIITTPNGQVENFSVGDEILAGVSLERILSDRVILNRDGASETLMLGGRRAGLSVITDDSRTIDADALNVGESEQGQNLNVQSAANVGRLAGPDEFFGAVSASPEMRDGTLIGYRLSPIGTADTMRRAGLQPGDILQAIDGVPVSDLNVSGLLDSISEIETAELLVNRDGSTQTVRLSFGE